MNVFFFRAHVFALFLRKLPEKNKEIPVLWFFLLAKEKTTSRALLLLCVHSCHAHLHIILIHPRHCLTLQDKCGV